MAESAHAEGKQVSICGELAGNPMAAVLLLAMGYDVLSMNATSLPRVKRAIRAITAADARRVWDEVRALESGVEVRDRLDRFLRERDLAQMAPAPVD